MLINASTNTVRTRRWSAFLHNHSMFKATDQTVCGTAPHTLTQAEATSVHGHGGQIIVHNSPEFRASPAAEIIHKMHQTRNKSNLRIFLNFFVLWSAHFSCISPVFAQIQRFPASPTAVLLLPPRIESSEWTATTNRPRCVGSIDDADNTSAKIRKYPPSLDGVQSLRAVLVLPSSHSKGTQQTGLHLHVYIYTESRQQTVFLRSLLARTGTGLCLCLRGKKKTFFRFRLR